MLCILRSSLALTSVAIATKGLPRRGNLKLRRSHGQRETGTSAKYTTRRRSSRLRLAATGNESISERIASPMPALAAPQAQLCKLRPCAYSFSLWQGARQSITCSPTRETTLFGRASLSKLCVPFMGTTPAPPTQKCGAMEW